MQLRSVDISNRLLAVIIISLMLVTSISIVVLSGNEEVPSSISDLNSETLDYPAGISVGLNLLQNITYKGAMIPIALQVEVIDGYTYMDTLSVAIRSEIYQKEAVQKVLINKTLAPGSHELSLELSPSFNYKSFLALNYGSYQFLNFSISYQQRRQSLEISELIDYTIEVIPYESVNQANELNWTTIITGNEISVSDNNITLISDGSGDTVLMTEIITAGYTSVDYLITGAVNSVVNISIGDKITSDYNGSIPIGVLTESANITLMANLTNSETVTISLEINTRKNVIFTVSANNFWTGLSSDSLIFQEPNYYISQISRRYERTFNISFIEVAEFHFNKRAGTNLFYLIADAKSQAAKSLFLDYSTWTADTGPMIENDGADIMFIFTNTTMDHLGVVIGTYGGAYNMAVNARGSKFQGDYRLPSSFADNLLQHEASHIFGAYDRWTYNEDPSVMTKSMPDDAFYDIVVGNFWLLRTNWLEVDIQIMIQESSAFLPN